MGSLLKAVVDVMILLIEIGIAASASNSSKTFG